MVSATDNFSHLEYSLSDIYEPTLEVNDEVLFESIARKVMAELPKRKPYEAVGFTIGCGWIGGYPMPEKYHTLTYIKQVETWTPLLDNYKKLGLWEIEL